MRVIGNRLKNIICGFLVLLLLIPSVTGFEINSEDENVEVERFEDMIVTNSGDAVNTNEIPASNVMQIRQEPGSDILNNGISLGLTQDELELFKRENPNLDLFHPRTLGSKVYPGIPIQTSEPANSGSASSSTSGTRSARVIDDLELWTLKWEEHNSAWCEQTDPEPSDYPGEPAHYYEGNQASIGSFFTGVFTEITITVRNNGVTAVTNVPVNLTITDFIHGGQPMAPNPTTLNIALISPDQTAEVTYDFKPPYGTTSFQISATVDWPKDPDTSNNFLGWDDRVVCKWQDDLEGSTAGWSHEARTDITATSVDDWHLSTSAYAQNDATHTQANSWYEGNNDGPGATYPLDGYRNDNALSLESPTVNLGNNVDERYWREYLGTVGGGPYAGYAAYQYHLTAYNWLITGETEENPNPSDYADYVATSDILWVGEVSDDEGQSWGQRYNLAFSGQLGGTGETQWYNYIFYTVNSDDQELYYYDGIPFNYNVSDWNKVRFRQTFDSDDDNVQEIGLYLDDYIIFGNDNFTIPYRVGVTDFTIPQVLGIPIVHPNEATTFSSKVKNYGDTNTFDVVLKIKDMDTEEEWEESRKKVTNLAQGDEMNQQWSWTPDKKGDFRLKVIAGDPTQDWTPSDNDRSRLVHVRAPSENDILVVDDDNGILNGGSYYREVESKMLDALDVVQVEYDVYTVDGNATGPALDIMEDYTTVIWLTGLDYQRYSDNWYMALKTEDEMQLEMFLELNDHNLWLISPGYIIDNYGVSPGITASDDFGRQYLQIWEIQGKVNEVEDRGTPDPLEGVLDTLTEDKNDELVSYATYEEDPPMYFSDIGCVAAPIPTEEAAEGIFWQNDQHTTYNAVSYAGDSTSQYKTVYFGFNFYLLDEAEDQADIVEKVLTFFGMMGGVEIECLGDETKWVKPGEEVSFQLKVTNLGKKTDTMTLTTEISSQTLPNTNDFPTTRIEIGGAVDDEIDVLVTQSTGNYKDNIYLIVTAPDWDLPTAMWKTEYIIEIFADSENTGMTNSTTVKIIIGLYSNITVSHSQVYKEIEVDDSWECTITLNNNTNGDQTFNVELRIDDNGEGLAKFVENDQKIILVTLSPNIDRLVKVKIQSGDYEFAGYHNITIEVKSTTPTILFDSTIIATKVTQFYEIGTASTAEMRVTIDPNDIVGDTISESFAINLQNFGNGYDNVILAIESHDKHNVEEEWLQEGIEIMFDGDKLELEYDESDEVLRTTDTVRVGPYDEDNDPEYGEEEVVITISINTSVEHAEYWFNVIAESEIGLSDELDEENNNITIMFEIIKPDLHFSPTDIDGRTHDNDRSRSIENYKIIDDDLDESVPWDEDTEEFIVTLDHTTEGKEITLRFEIVIVNIGDSAVELQAVIQSIIIEVSYWGEDEFGELALIEDIALYPVSPTEVTIEPGENATIIFEAWVIEWLDPGNNVEQVYIFNVIVDKEDFILEQDEGNNEDSFEMVVIHQKKPAPPPPPEASGWLIAMIIIIIIIVVVLAVFLLMKRKRPQQNEEEDTLEVLEPTVDNPKLKP